MRQGITFFIRKRVLPLNLFAFSVFLFIPLTLSILKPIPLNESSAKIARAIIPSPTIAAEGYVLGSKTVSVTPTPEKKQTIEVLTPTTALTPIPTVYTNKSTQVNETTWRITLEEDSQMASAQEIFNALNSYRQKKGKTMLANDDKLAQYALSRATYFTSHGSMDSHAGFNDYISNKNGFHDLGFSALGENSAYLGGPISGVRIIEVIFAGDAPHDNNQLDSGWTHVGVAVSGLAVDLVFGGRKM